MRRARRSTSNSQPRTRSLLACPRWALAAMLVTGVALGWFRGMDISDSVSLERGNTATEVLSAASVVPTGTAIRDCQDYPGTIAWVDVCCGVASVLGGTAMAVFAAPELAVVGGAMVVAGLTGGTVRGVLQSRRQNEYIRLADAAAPKALDVPAWSIITVGEIKGQKPLAKVRVNGCVSYSYRRATY